MWLRKTRNETAKANLFSRYADWLIKIIFLYRKWKRFKDLLHVILQNIRNSWIFYVMGSTRFTLRLSNFNNVIASLVSLVYRSIMWKIFRGDYETFAKYVNEQYWHFDNIWSSKNFILLGFFLQENLLFFMINGSNCRTKL